MVRCVKLLIAFTGIGSGHTLESNPIAKGYIDYWEDVEGDKQAVKAWIDGNYLSVMYIAGDIDNMNFNLQQMFLNGFRFPEQSVLSLMRNLSCDSNFFLEIFDIAFKDYFPD